MKKIAGVVPAGILDQHVAILGKTRSGKSSVMRQFVEALLEAGKPVCIVDPKGDWWGIKLAKDGRSPGYPVVMFGNSEHADVPINEHAGGHVAELFATDNRPCLIDLGGWTVGARTRFWIDFASTLFKLTKGNRYLAVDEFHNFCPKGKVMDADAGKMLHWSNRLMSEGLGKGLNMLIASQRPQKVHNDSLTSAETLIAMRVLHPSDRGAVSDWIKGCGDGSGDQVLNSLGQMERGEGWVWSPEIGFGPARVKFPMFSTYDSFRPQTVEDAKRLKGWAEIDLDEVRAKLGKVVEEAKANDPKELKRQIAELRKALSDSERKSAALSDSDAKRQPAKISPALTDGDRALIEKLTNALLNARDSANTILAAADDRLNTRVRDAIADYQDTTKGIGLQVVEEVERRLGSASVKKLLEKLNGLSATPVPGSRFQVPRTVTESASHLTSGSAIVPAPRGTKSPVASSNGSKLGKPERAILLALANNPNGVVKGKLTILAGYTWSGTFSNAVSACRTAGYLEGANDGVMRITRAGLDALGPFDPLPTGAQLAQYWLSHRALGKPERLALEALLQHRAGLDKDQLCAVTGYQFSGTFSNALSALRTMGLLIGKNTETMRAHPDLFD